MLEELKKEYGFSYEIIDTSKSYGEVNAVYKLCAHWAMTGSEGRRIYEIFKSANYAGSLFGRGIPALLVYHVVIHTLLSLVFPHNVVRGQKEETITIHDFLTALKEHLKS